MNALNWAWFDLWASGLANSNDKTDSILRVSLASAWLSMNKSICSEANSLSGLLRTQIKTRRCRKGMLYPQTTINIVLGLFSTQIKMKSAEVWLYHSFSSTDKTDRDLFGTVLNLKKWKTTLFIRLSLIGIYKPVFTGSNVPLVYCMQELSEDRQND